MKRSEYEEKAKAFRALLEVESQKDQPDWDQFEGDNWLSVGGTATCTTPACPAFGVPCPQIFHENADGIHRGICGHCNQPTEIRLNLEEG